MNNTVALLCTMIMHNGGG